MVPCVACIQYTTSPVLQARVFTHHLHRVNSGFTIRGLLVYTLRVCVLSCRVDACMLVYVAPLVGGAVGGTPVRHLALSQALSMQCTAAV